MLNNQWPRPNAWAWKLYTTLDAASKAIFERDESVNAGPICFIQTISSSSL